MSSTRQGAGAKASVPDALVARLGHRFADRSLIERALTHPSALAQGRSGPGSYERLEFLGDRVLGLVVADLLLKRFPGEAEGALARRHAALVRREALAEVGAALKLGLELKLSRPEEEGGGRSNPALLADACEAVIGALYVDGGLEAARALIERFWAELIEADLTPPQDAKTALQEWAQGRGLPLPGYREVGRSGPDHELRFTVEVSVEGHQPATGEGRSKRLAEQAAAERLLARLDRPL